MQKDKSESDELSGDPDIIDTATWLTLAQVAAFFETSETTIKSWIAEGLLHPQKEGRQFVFDPRDIAECAKLRAAGEGKGFAGRNMVTKFEMGMQPNPDGGPPSPVYFKGQTELQTVINAQGRMLRDQHDHIQKMHHQTIAINKSLAEHLGKMELRAEALEKERFKFLHQIEEMFSQRHVRELESERQKKKLELMDGIAKKIMFGIDRAMPGLLKKAGIALPSGNGSHAAESSHQDTPSDATDESSDELQGPRGLAWFLDNAVTAKQAKDLYVALGKEHAKVLREICGAAEEKTSDKRLREFVRQLAGEPETLSKLPAVLEPEQLAALQKLIEPYL